MDFLKKNDTKVECQNQITIRIASMSIYLLGFFLAMFLCNCVHLLLRPLSQPRIIAESIVGLLLSNLEFVRNRFLNDNEVQQTLNYIVDAIMVCHMFVVGLEIDPNIFLQLTLPEAKVAYSGVLTTFVFACLVTPLLHISKQPNAVFSSCLAIVLAGTDSPLLTRLITDLKIGKSDIGRFIVEAGIQSDVVSILLITIGFLVFDPDRNFQNRSVKTMLKMMAILVFQTLLASKVVPSVMKWVNNENPEGKPMKGSHLVVALAFIISICSMSPIVGFSKVLSAFLVGLFMPREGRISKMMIGKVNYIFRTIFYPLFFFWVGTEAKLSEFEAGKIATWAKIVVPFLIATGGKVLGSVVSGLMLGFHWPESVATGLLLNIKGHFQVYLAINAYRMNIISMSTSIVLVFVTFLTIIYTPVVVAKIIERARKRSPTQKMALQWLNSTNELRILVCIRSSQNVFSAINFMEISRGPANPGIMVYLTDMIELTDKIAATLTQGRGVEVGAGVGVDAVTVTDPAVVEMREKITKDVHAYLNEDCEGINLQRMMALSTINNMHQDISILAEDLLVHLVILPFHKNQEEDGRLHVGHSGFRHINRKVLRNAPCSVGILVDRGLGKTVISRSSISLNAAVIFIGGKDDREALVYAGRVARHPGVKLTVIRFLVEAAGDSVSSRVGRAKSNTTEHLEEMKIDDECFAEFYDKHVAGGRVAYVEKYLVNSGQTFSTLRSLEGQYGLFIVGRGGRVNSVLTVGMSDWEECPELGPIGDILSASDFSVTASVLIIQQHSLKGELDGLHDEFSIM
ncbi:cation/H(+) antiporter 28 [Nicotiana sylvestris]|uniref:Cation/H(+) antiporter 28 n=1 Tax=Nicotiana sylvestris TaxID=4096 RepID=A0A1U7XM86_NICSY|nr:PREDICTED: cation/H(+) antiporter 28 [Nicotiana sylvestris]